MEDVEVLLNPDFSVTSPNFGDGEMTSIVFANPNIELRLSAHRDSKDFSIEMMGVEFFHFETTHPQNVVDQFYIYPDRATYMASQVKGAVLPEPDRPEIYPRTIVVIQPIAGPDMTCLCKQVKIRVSD